MTFSIHFRCYVAHRDLHSFPTRRSSDLVIVTDNMFGDIITDLGAMVQGGMGIAAGGNINPQGTDRKSTRLNSSHEWISYAVFCLKKKTYNKKITMQVQMSDALEKIHEYQ